MQVKDSPEQEELRKFMRKMMYFGNTNLIEDKVRKNIQKIAEKKGDLFTLP